MNLYECVLTRLANLKKSKETRCWSHISITVRLKLSVQIVFFSAKVLNHPCVQTVLKRLQYMSSFVQWAAKALNNDALFWLVSVEELWPHVLIRTVKQSWRKHEGRVSFKRRRPHTRPNQPKGWIICKRVVLKSLSLWQKSSYLQNL